MEIKILENSKDEIKIELDSLTIVELLRVYLNKDSNVILAVWRREHPTKNPILTVKTKGKVAKKVVSDAISFVTKDLDKLAEDFKKIGA